MLSNSDFKEKFLSPAGSSKEKDDKSWEVKQIKAWDQQLKSKAGGGAGKGGNKKLPPGRPVEEKKQEVKDTGGYRDRAAEVL